MEPCNCGHGRACHLIRSGCARCSCKAFLQIGWEVFDWQN